MRSYLWLIGCLLGGFLSWSQECPSPLLLEPRNGTSGVALDATIRWEPVTGVPGYVISLGTSPGGTELLDQQQLGSATSYAPPRGWPEDTTIYVTITLYFFETGIPDIPCPPESFRTRQVTGPPSCTSLESPENGSNGGNPGTQIRWNYVPGASGYRIQVGTAEGQADLYDQDVGNLLNFKPPADLPEDQLVYVRIIPYNRFGPATACGWQAFRTGTRASLPGCTRLRSPVNGALEVPLTPLIEWDPVPGATGYRVTLGESPFTAEILDGAVFDETSTFVLDFEPNRTFFIRIVPFNEAGDALDCTQESFSTRLGCGPHFDPDTGQLVRLNPGISLPGIVALCTASGELPVLTAPDLADGYRWYRVMASGEEQLLSETVTLQAETTGNYRYEIYNITPDGLECSSTRNFELVYSGLPEELDVFLSETSGMVRLEVSARGPGNYVFSIDGPDGPFQESPVFPDLPPENNTLWVLDRNGCGVLDKDLASLRVLSGFPPYFTPNGDSQQDTWQFKPLPGAKAPQLWVEVFDRLGTPLARFPAHGEGWNGHYQGRPLPSGNYWFRATTADGLTYTGYFLLKR